MGNGGHRRVPEAEHAPQRHDSTADAGHDALRRQLREAAHGHRPDRARMLARVQRGMAAPPVPHERAAARRPVAPWLRVVGATAAVAGVFAAGGYGVASAVRGEGSAPQTVATTPTPEQVTTTPDRPDSSSTRRPQPPEPSSDPSRPAGRGQDTSTSTSASTDKAVRTVPADELLWADGSIDPGSSAYWGQSNITVKAEQPLTGLTVELRIAGDGDPQDTGSWRSLPAEDFAVSVTRQDGGLVYRWTLRQGRTVPAGEHVFAAQYDHAQGERDAGDDVYTVSARTAAEQAEWQGDFE